jgi:hypothetical protein
MSGGRKIIEGLQDAVRGNFTRVTLQGQVWVRHDVGSPEHELSTARAKVAELTERADVLEAEVQKLTSLLWAIVDGDELSSPPDALQHALEAAREYFST